MTAHVHVRGWPLCDLCGIRAPMDCPTCRAVHEKLHHYGRQLRRLEKTMRGKR